MTERLTSDGRMVFGQNPRHWLIKGVLFWVVGCFFMWVGWQNFIDEPALGLLLGCMGVLTSIVGSAMIVWRDSLRVLVDQGTITVEGLPGAERICIGEITDVTYDGEDVILQKKEDARRLFPEDTPVVRIPDCRFNGRREVEAFMKLVRRRTAA